ncbi:hypothetical protein PSAC2689_40368 [Paraburkholderia sacchari]
MRNILRLIGARNFSREMVKHREKPWFTGLFACAPSIESEHQARTDS